MYIVQYTLLSYIRARLSRWAGLSRETRGSTATGESTTSILAVCASLARRTVWTVVTIVTRISLEEGGGGEAR